MGRPYQQLIIPRALAREPVDPPYLTHPVSSLTAAFHGTAANHSQFLLRFSLGCSCFCIQTFEDVNIIFALNR